MPVCWMCRSYLPAAMASGFQSKTNPAKLESEIALRDFPSPGQLWDKLCTWKGYTKLHSCLSSAGLLLGWQPKILPAIASCRPSNKTVKPSQGEIGYCW